MYSNGGNRSDCGGGSKSKNISPVVSQKSGITVRDYHGARVQANRRRNKDVKDEALSFPGSMQRKRCGEEMDLKKCDRP